MKAFCHNYPDNSDIVIIMIHIRTYACVKITYEVIITDRNIMIFTTVKILSGPTKRSCVHVNLCISHCLLFAHCSPRIHCLLIISALSVGNTSAAVCESVEGAL